MKRYSIEIKTSLKNHARYMNFYMKAYSKEQILDQLGDEYYIVSIEYVPNWDTAKDKTE